MHCMMTLENVLTANYSCIVVPFFADQKMQQQHPALIELDDASSGYISELIKVGDITGKKAVTTLLYDLDNVTSERVLIVGLGTKKQFSFKTMATAIAAAYKVLESINVKDVGLYWLADNWFNYQHPVNLKYLLRHLVSNFSDLNYQFNGFKTDNTAYQLQQLAIHAPTSAKLSELELELELSIYINEAKTTAKDLIHLPGNVCTPEYLAKYAVDLTKTHKNLSTAVLGMTEIKALGMGAFYAVAKGSNNPGKLITISYQGADKSNLPIIFIGKGVTFDTGGNSLKPPKAMIGMKYDMAGAATVVGLMEFIAKAKLPLNVIGILAAAENMPGANAARPDDIITSMSGKTIEILNTDAEGRLVLCDSITYAKRFNPEMIIDFATLTGSAKETFAEVFSALFSNDTTLAQELLTASVNSDDLAWQLPLAPEYHTMMESKVADFANMGTGGAGASVAACFLEKFVDDITWAHLDIAGSVGHMSGRDKGANGRPIPMIAEFLLQRCNYNK